ncbi:hypothetical protein PHMEG_0004301 [Phytophthora megakarya]|uniref:Uncharacterized protein n=1 Tax=Phytophthora megakarya TaxID=4795 RepID=A0A225WU34_9STRA|nr:hypothetical protein PHMEG_0004301 [Phytophthora megakarya]
MSKTKIIAPCEGCGEPVGPVHSCPLCSCHMHPFCGRGVGEEGFGQNIQCPSCDQNNSTGTMTSPRHGQDMAGVEVTESRDSENEKAFDISVATSTFQEAHSSRKHHCKPSGSHTLAARLRAKGCYRPIPRHFEFFYTDCELAKGNGLVAKAGQHYGHQKRADCDFGASSERNPWVEWLYPRLLEEFDRLRKLGVKYEPPLLLQLAKQILSDNTDGYNSRSVNDKGALIINKITSRCVQTFMEAHQIALRTRSGKKHLSAAKILHIEKCVAFHLGELRQGFADGSLDEDAIENIDETHFVVDFDNGKTLGFSGEKHIKYADVVSGGEGMPMVGNYPIRGVKDNVPGVCYRTCNKGWMTQKNFENTSKGKEQ